MVTNIPMLAKAVFRREVKAVRRTPGWARNLYTIVHFNDSAMDRGRGGKERSEEETRPSGREKRIQKGMGRKKKIGAEVEKSLAMLLAASHPFNEATNASGRSAALHQDSCSSYTFLD